MLPAQQPKSNTAKILQLLSPEEKKIVELISKSIIKKTFSLESWELPINDSLSTISIE